MKVDAVHVSSGRGSQIYHSWDQVGSKTRVFLDALFSKLFNFLLIHSTFRKLISGQQSNSSMRICNSARQVAFCYSTPALHSM